MHTLSSRRYLLTFESNLKVVLSAESDGPKESRADVGTILIRVPELKESEWSLTNNFRPTLSKIANCGRFDNQLITQNGFCQGENSSNDSTLGTKFGLIFGYAVYCKNLYIYLWKNCICVWSEPNLVHNSPWRWSPKQAQRWVRVTQKLEHDHVAVNVLAWKNVKGN